MPIALSLMQVYSWPQRNHARSAKSHCLHRELLAAHLLPVSDAIPP